MNNALLDPSIIYLRTVNSDESNRNCKENNFEKVKEIIESKENFTPTNTHLVLALETRTLKCLITFLKKEISIQENIKTVFILYSSN